MSVEDAEIRAKIEAALYAAGRPLSPEDLTRAAGVKSKRRVLASARALLKNVNRALNAVEVVELEDRRFVMQLKQRYNKVARKFATKPLLSDSTMRTLSYIVYFQPITASELAVRRGSQIYQHLRQLEHLSFIRGEALGRTKSYKTTSTFSEYFGLSSDPRVMKQQLARLRPLALKSE